MGYCAAPCCKNKSTDGIRLFRFPRDKKRQDQWVQNCKRDKWQPTHNSKLCEHHFEESQFEQNRADGRKLLKWNAVPTLFNVPNPLESVHCKRKSTEERQLPFQRSNKAAVDEAGSSAMVEGEEYYNAEEGEWLEKLDTGQLCRICANPNEYLIPIFEGEGLEHELALKIKKHLPIEVSEADTLPRQVCYQCASTLIAWHDLVICCVEADKKLQELQAEENQDDQTAEAFEAESYDSDIAEGTAEHKEDIADGKEPDKTTKPPTKRTSHLAKEKKSKQKSLVESSGLEKSTELIESVSQEEKASESAKPNEAASQESSERCGQSSLSTYRAFLEANNSVSNLSKKKDGTILSTFRSYLEATNMPSSCQKYDHISVSSSWIKEEVIKEADTESTRRCSMCEKSFATKNEMETHLLHVHKQCSISCGKGRGKIMNASATINQKKDSFSCKDCGKSFPRSYELKKHLKYHASEFETDGSESSNSELCFGDQCFDQEPEGGTRKKCGTSSSFSCIHCRKQFNLKDSYLRHLRIHTGERPFTCHVCGKQFRDSGGLARHIKDVHAGIKNFDCDLCGRSFASKATREDHRRIHTGERPYICDSCGKTFRAKASLYIHSKIHTDSFPHECTYCGKRFRRRQELLAHVTTHTGEKPHICDICAKCFRVKGELMRHKLVHSTEKPHVCSLCGLSFRQKRYLKNHERAVHLNKEGLENVDHI